MPAAKFSIKTPRGEFASAPKAAAAHAVSVGIILTRCKTDPANYKKIPKASAEPKPKVWGETARVTWPLTWTQYKGLAFEIKEDIWLKWCKRTGLNPDLESTADEFFRIMDQTQEESNEEQAV